MLELLRNAQVFAPEPLGRRDLLVGGGSVLWIGSGAPSFPGAYGAAEVDLTGKRLLPGLVDNQALFAGGGGEAGFESRVPALPLSSFTAAGVTTVVGMLGTDDFVRTTAELLARTRALRAEGLSAYALTGGYHVPPTTLTGSVKGDIVHVAEIIGVGELALSDHRSSQPTLEEVLRIASDAHVAGLMTGKAGYVHFHMGDGERGLELINAALDQSEIPPRVFHPTHVNRRRRLFREACVLVERGCSIDVTAMPVVEPDEVDAADAIETYLDAKLPPDRLTMSTDAGGCLPEFDADGRVERMGVGDPRALWETIRRLLDRGRTLEQLLPIVTSNPANLLRLGNKGKIAVGADADLLVVDEAGELESVMARGAWHIRQKVTQRHGTFEATRNDPTTSH